MMSYMGLAFFLFNLNAHTLEAIPAIKPTTGSWIAYNQYHTLEGVIAKHKVSKTKPMIKPWIGPKIHPRSIVGTQEKEILTPMPGIFTEMKFSRILKAMIAPSRAISLIELNIRYGAKGKKKRTAFCFLNCLSIIT